MLVIIFTNTGLDRKFNEDAVLAGDIFQGFLMEAPMVATEPGFLVAVADGMGGGPGGAQASKIVLEALKELPEFSPESDHRDLLVNCLNLASQKLNSLGLGQPQLVGLGSTVAGLWRKGDSATIFNCGDCRVYRSRRGSVDLLSRDHSTVYNLYLEGLISFEDIRHHPQRHLITSAIQGGSTVNIEVFTRKVLLKNGDLFLICSDGVWESIDGDLLEQCLSDGEPELAALRLMACLEESKVGDDHSFLLHKVIS
ncbi:MAG: serine/threonine-protein phosphatase [Deltaproteobacteria bacterium]|nr:serine/threonine-protein phosphatase [Deltaproteobacteria bacterium]